MEHSYFKFNKIPERKIRFFLQFSKLTVILGFIGFFVGLEYYEFLIEPLYTFFDFVFIYSPFFSYFFLAIGLALFFSTLYYVIYNDILVKVLFSKKDLRIFFHVSLLDEMFKSYKKYNLEAYVTLYQKDFYNLALEFSKIAPKDSGYTINTSNIDKYPTPGRLVNMVKSGAIKDENDISNLIKNFFIDVFEPFEGSKEEISVLKKGFFYRLFFLFLGFLMTLLFFLNLVFFTDKEFYSFNYRSLNYIPTSYGDITKVEIQNEYLNYTDTDAGRDKRFDSDVCLYSKNSCIYDIDISSSRIFPANKLADFLLILKNMGVEFEVAKIFNINNVNTVAGKNSYLNLKEILRRIGFDGYIYDNIEYPLYCGDKNSLAVDVYSPVFNRAKDFESLANEVLISFTHCSDNKSILQILRDGFSNRGLAFKVTDNGVIQQVGDYKSNQDNRWVVYLNGKILSNQDLLTNTIGIEPLIVEVYYLPCSVINCEGGLDAFEEVGDSKISIYRFGKTFDEGTAGYYYELGYDYWLKEDWRKAEEYYKKSLEVDDGYVPALSSLGLIKFRYHDDFMVAEKFLLQAVDKDKGVFNWGFSSFNLGILYYEWSGEVSRQGLKNNDASAYDRAVSLLTKSHYYFQYTLDNYYNDPYYDHFVKQLKEREEEFGVISKSFIYKD